MQVSGNSTAGATSKTTGRAWILGALLLSAPGLALSQSPADAVVRQLQNQGYVEFNVSRTLLGRIRVVAVAPDGSEREIVFNPSSGEILRDYIDAEGGGTPTPQIMERPAGGSAAEPGPDASPSGDDARGRGNGGGSDQGDGGGQGSGNGRGNGGGSGQGDGGGQGNGNAGGNGNGRGNGGGSDQGNGQGGGGGQGNGNGNGNGQGSGNGGGNGNGRPGGGDD